MLASPRVLYNEIMTGNSLYGHGELTRGEKCGGGGGISSLGSEDSFGTVSGILLKTVL